MVSLALLAGAGIGLVAALNAGLRSEYESAERERSFQSANRVLTAMTLLTSEELDRRLGRHPIGDLLLDVQRPEPTLYRIAILPGLAPENELLVTVVHRLSADRR
jgi:hypothetical protein